MRETWIQSLGREDPLEKEMATHSSTLAWKIPWMKEPGRLQSVGSQRVGHDWETSPYLQFSSVQSLSRVWLCDPMNCSMPSLPVPPSIRVFSNESTLCMRWPKYWSFSFSISPSKEHPRLISFSMDWLDLLAVQGTHKSLLQHHSSKASILWRSAFFTVQLSHPYMTTGKTIALTRWTFVGKVMSLLLNMLSRLVITFLSVVATPKIRYHL